jgi:hemolysin activation/secretion protein
LRGFLLAGTSIVVTTEFSIRFSIRLGRNRAKVWLCRSTLVGRHREVGALAHVISVRCTTDKRRAEIKNHGVKPRYYLLLPLLASASAAWSTLPLPTAGTLLPPAANDAAHSTLPLLDVERSAPLPSTPTSPATDRKLLVQHLRIKGASVFLPSLLLANSGFVAGESYTLQDLQAIADRIQRYYRDHGYPLAQAYLPAQDMRVDELTITISLMEGRYGQVLVRNQSHASSGILSDMLQDLQPGNVVQGETLDSSLLMLSDLPGLHITSALVPGTALGTSDLLVDVLPTHRVTGAVDADNAGNYYTGAVRVGASMFLNEPSGEGDLASLRLQTSGEGLNYVRAAYQLQVGQARVGAAWSSMEYTLGRDFESLLANGTARTLGFFASYPLVRSRNGNLVGSVSYDDKRF